MPKEIYSKQVEEIAEIKHKSDADSAEKTEKDEPTKKDEKSSDVKGAKVIFMGDTFDITVRKYNLPPGSIQRRRRR